MNKSTRKSGTVKLQIVNKKAWAALQAQPLLSANPQAALPPLSMIGQAHRAGRRHARTPRNLARYLQALIGPMAEEVVWERFFKASCLQSARTNGFRGVVRMKTGERENAA